MASLAEFARARTALSGDEIAHLQRLVAAWALPCDLSFADVLLSTPVDPDDRQTDFVVLGHARSAAGAHTAYAYCSFAILSGLGLSVDSAQCRPW